MSRFPPLPEIRDPFTVDPGELRPVPYEKVASAQWLTFTPTWSSTGVAPAIGDGVLTGRYVKLGRIVHVRMFWKAGSTSTFGNGVYTFTLPRQAQDAIGGAAGDPVIGSGVLIDSGTQFYVVTGIISAAATTIFLVYEGATGMYRRWYCSSSGSQVASSTSTEPIEPITNSYVVAGARRCVPPESPAVTFGSTRFSVARTRPSGSGNRD